MATGRVERKLAAILAADVAGYSRLMGADEEGTLAQLKALRRERVPSSSAPIRRLYPATSAARMAASLRSTRPVAKAVLPNRVGD